MHCAYCGGQNPEDARFCAHCARSLQPASAAATPPPAQPVPAAQPDRVPLTGDPIDPPPGPGGAPSPAAPTGAPYTCAVCGYVLGPFDQACARCKTPRGMRVDPAAAMPGTYMPVPGLEAGMVNTSGARSTVPEDVKRGWNWGGCTLGCFWALAMRMPLWALAALVSGFCALLSIPLAIFLGIKGNELAWQNRHFESVEQFRAVQRAWAIWGVSVTIIATVLYLVFFIIRVATGNLR